MEDLVEMWHAHNAITLYLLNNLPEGGLTVTPTFSEMGVDAMFAHINDLRLRWMHQSEPDLVQPLPWFEHQPERPIDLAQLQRAIEGSGEAVEAMITRRALAGRGIDGFPGSLASFLAYLISHESYHWGEIAVALTQAGRPLSKEVALGIWRGWWGRATNDSDT